MLDELQQIDTSAIEELRTIKAEQEVLRDRLARMEERRASVSEAVFARVRGDYEERHTALEESARPLKERARAEFATLRSLLERLAGELDSATLAKEELIFRHELGEFEDSEFESRLRDAEARVESCTSNLADGEALRARFVAAFHSEEELLQPPKPPARGGRTKAEKAIPEPEVTDRTLAAPPPPPAEGTVIGAMPVVGVDAPASEGTVVLAKPRLIGERPDGTLEEFPLGFATTTIGRSPANDICISDDAVSRRHAKVMMTENGFQVVDLGSENGVYVNGERIAERLLADGDVVEIGPGTRRYVFRAS